MEHPRCGRTRLHAWIPSLGVPLHESTDAEPARPALTFNPPKRATSLLIFVFFSSIFFLNTRNAEFFWLFTDDCRSSDHLFLASTKHDEFLYIFLPFVYICMTVFIPKSVKTTSKTESLPLQNQEKFLQVSLLFLSYIFIFTYQC